jgi:hypothetical protein
MAFLAIALPPRERVASGATYQPTPEEALWQTCER